MSIRFTLIGILGILTAIVAYASYGSLHNLENLNRHAIKYRTITVPAVRLLGEISADIGNFRYVEAEHIFTQDLEKILVKEQELAKILFRIRVHMRDYEALIIKAEEIKIYQAFVAGWERYL